MPERVVVVTGASAGVGRATAKAFAAKGAKIGLIARGAERLEETRREIERSGGKALALPADVADPGGIDEAAARAERELGPIDVWVNDAMATVFSPFERITPDEYRRVTEVTYLGAVHGTMAALKLMRPRGCGHIVQVGSALAYRSIPLQSAYCGAKAAIRGFTDSVRCELIHDKSRIVLTCVHMPALNTPQFDWARNKMGFRAQPIPPIFNPEVAARAIVFASEHRRREIYVGGPTLEAVFGNMALPGYLDRLLAAKAYGAQLTHEAESEGRPDNLFAPGSSPHAAHGRFDSQSRNTSHELWATEHARFAVGLGLGAVAGLGIALRLLRGGK